MSFIWFTIALEQNYTFLFLKNLLIKNNKKQREQKECLDFFSKYTQKNPDFKSQ